MINYHLTNKHHVKTKKGRGCLCQSARMDKNSRQIVQSYFPSIIYRIKRQKRDIGVVTDYFIQDQI